MSQTTSYNYLRSYRRKAGFSQDELAYLLGCADGGKVSRYERRTRLPSLETILTYRAALGVSVTELFRGHYQKVEQDIRRRASTLAQQLAEEEYMDPRTALKLSSLEQVIKPAVLGTNHEIKPETSPGVGPNS